MAGHHALPRLPTISAGKRLPWRFMPWCWYEARSGGVRVTVRARAGGGGMPVHRYHHVRFGIGRSVSQSNSIGGRYGLYRASGNALGRVYARWWHRHIACADPICDCRQVISARRAHSPCPPRHHDNRGIGYQCRVLDRACVHRAIRSGGRRPGGWRSVPQ